ncbi:MAG: sulfatase-like hydrolase/transferase [Labilithrix sp.]|nr:sulfatase-like hydrolase/transferase [Labilithrix sp.]
MMRGRAFVATFAFFVVAQGACGGGGAVVADAQDPPDATIVPGEDASASVDASADASVEDARTSDVASEGEAGDASAPRVPPNILLVIGDDMGLDASVCHTVGADPGRAPHLQALCASGVVFDNVWTAPVCSPTRAGILTGRHSFRTGVGTVNLPLPVGERALPKALVAGKPGYATAAFGKWHLSNASNGGANHPNNVGFAQFSGSLGAQVSNFFNWSRVTNGLAANTTTYATTANVNDANAWIQAQTTPWFVWLAFNAPHAPFHVPPAGLHTYTTLTGPPLPNPPIDHYHAALEAMDTELGRLLGGLSPTVRAKTWVIFVGDNGTPPEVTQAPYTASKGSLYQGGVHVPLFISGPGVVDGGRRVSAIVHTVDIFKTVLELAEVDMGAALPAGGNTVDSVSLVPYLTSANQAPLRPWVMTEVFGGAPFAGGRLGKAIRDERYKLIRFNDGGVELYDLDDDPYEASELHAAGPLSIDAEMHEAALGAALDTLLASP